MLVCILCEIYIFNLFLFFCFQKQKLKMTKTCLLCLHTTIVEYTRISGTFIFRDYLDFYSISEKKN